MKLLDKPHRRDGTVMIAVAAGGSQTLDALPEFVAYSLATWKRHALDGERVYYEHAGLATTNSPYTRVSEAGEESPD
jgi:hypothetical protein